MRRSKQSACFLLFCVGILLLGPAPVGATIYNEVRITDNIYQDEYPWVGGNKIVWQGWDKFDYEIYCYDIITGQTTEISHNVFYDDVLPTTDGEYIMWRQREPGEYDGSLYLHEIGTGETTLVVEDVSGGSMDGGIVAWVTSTPTSDDRELFLYDASTGETLQITDDDLGDTWPIVNQGRVAWLSYVYEPRTHTIRLYDVSTGETVDIHTAEPIYVYDFNGNHVAWMEYVSENVLEVFVHDLVSGETLQITDQGTDKGNTLLVGGNAILWRENYPTQVPNKWFESRLHYWDAQTEQTQVIYDTGVTGGHFWNTRVQGQDVVWTARILVGENIHHHDLSTGIQTQVTQDPFTDEEAAVYDGIVVWQGFEPVSQRYEIYMGVPCLDGDGDGFEAGTCGGTDCNDEDPAVYPGAPGEVPGDQIDTNCNGSDDCFIATAAFGSPGDYKIEVLRTFRDHVLMAHPAGLALVEAYYEYSPPIAEIISEQPWMRALIRGLLLPFVGFAFLFT